MQITENHLSKECLKFFTIFPAENQTVLTPHPPSLIVMIDRTRFHFLSLAAKPPRSMILTADLSMQKLQIIHADWSRACHVTKCCTPNGYWPNRRPLLLRTKLCIETAVETVGKNAFNLQKAMRVQAKRNTDQPDVCVEH